MLNKPMTHSKTTVAALVVFFILCLSYLAHAEMQQQDYNYGESWWTTYFNDPKDANLSFAIENHSKEKAFHWELSSDKALISQGDATIGLGEKKLISVQSAQDMIDKKMTIKISTSKGFKEIYKKL